jgi:hypothetical protein
VSRIGNPQTWHRRKALPTTSRRYSRFGNLRYDKQAKNYSGALPNRRYAESRFRRTTIRPLNNTKDENDLWNQKLTLL